VPYSLKNVIVLISSISQLLCDSNIKMEADDVEINQSYKISCF